MAQVKTITLISNYQNSLITRQLFLSSQQIRLQHNVAVATPEQTSSKPTESEWDRARPFSKMPSPTVFTMFRNIGKYSKMDSAQIMLGMKEDYGDIFRLPKLMGRPSIVFTYQPDDFEKVFRNEGIWPSRPGAETLKHHREVHRADFFQGVEGIISTQGKKWGDFRTVVNPVLMQPKNVRLYFSKMSQVNWEFIQRIKDIRDPKTLEVPADFEVEINRWTLESVSVVALDKKMGLLGEQRDNPDAKLLFESMEEFIKLTFELEFKLSLWKYIKTPKYKRLMKSLDNVQAITARCVNDAIARLEIENANNVEKPDSEKSVLEKLLKIDKKVAMVMAMDMLMAGVDTTSSTFTAIMLCLAKNPEKQNKLREEIMQILPDKNSEFTEESMKNIPYLRACIKESMRLYPLITGNARIPQKDVVLSGFQVPKGTLVSMVALSLLKDEHNFPRAKEFLPERWLRPNKEDAAQCPNALKSNNPFTFLPFGFGPRSCIGKRIVDMELEMGVARIIRHFDVEFNHSTENAFKSLLISVPNIPLKFKFTDINK